MSLFFDLAGFSPVVGPHQLRTHEPTIVVGFVTNSKLAIVYTQINCSIQPKDPRLRKVVVTGGNGYIGSNLIQALLNEGFEVHAFANGNHQRLDAMLPRENVHVLNAGPGAVVDVVTRLAPDTIFHMAAVYAEPVSTECILNMIQGNLTLGACLLFAATQCAKTPAFVNTGTYWQFDENAVYRPNTLYSATKHAFQNILQYYRDRCKIRSTTLVLYDTFGPSDDRGKIWSRLITSTPGTHISLTSGHQYIEPLHIEDTVSAFIQAARLLQGEAELLSLYCIHSGSKHTFRSLVDALNVEADLKLNLAWGEAEYWEGQVFNPWLGETLPGWAPKHDVLESLVQLAREYQALRGETL